VPVPASWQWFTRYDADDWDRQIASDAKSGKLTPYLAKAGIVPCTFDPDFRGQAQRIHAAVATASDTRNLVIRVNRPG
jgi:hypothetical protein